MAYFTTHVGDVLNVYWFQHPADNVYVARLNLFTRSASSAVLIFIPARTAE